MAVRRAEDSAVRRIARTRRFEDTPSTEHLRSPSRTSRTDATSSRKVRDRALFFRCPPRGKVGSDEIARTVPGGGDLEGLLIGPLLLRLCLQLQERIAASGRHSGCASGDARTKVAPTRDRDPLSHRRRTRWISGTAQGLRCGKLKKRDESQSGKLATPASARLEPDARWLSVHCVETRERCARRDARIGTASTHGGCLLYTSPSPRDATLSRMPSSA